MYPWRRKEMSYAVARAWDSLMTTELHGLLELHRRTRTMVVRITQIGARIGDKLVAVVWAASRARKEEDGGSVCHGGSR